MAMRKSKPDPLLDAFVETALELASFTKGLRLDALARHARLACLRRSVLDSLVVDGFLEAGDPDDLWDQAIELGCPMLDSMLDGTGPDPRLAAAVAVTPARVPTPGQCYQQLMEFGLARQGKGRKLTGTLSRSTRRRNGAFFTPAWMADRLAELLLESWPNGSGGAVLPKLLDPACGDGRLLVACARRMLRDPASSAASDPDRFRALVRDSLRGVDLDPVCAALARCALWRECDPGRGPVEGLGAAVVVGDAIGGPLRKARTKSVVRWERDFPQACGPGAEGFDLVVANPPFEVLTGFAKRAGLKRYAERIRKAGYELALAGNLNTYRLFLERTCQLLSDGGRLAIVLPFGFLMDRTATTLRSHMLCSGWIERVEVFPESRQAFDQVGQSVILLAATKRDRPGRSIEVVDGADRQRAHSVALAEIEGLDPQNLVLPVESGDAIGLAFRLRAVNGSCLGELAEGRVGELDQTQYRDCMCSQPADGLLVRGTHLGPFSVDLATSQPEERWVDRERFFGNRGGGTWREDMRRPRVVQTGIVNMEAARRLVAAEVPADLSLGNSVNYWVPRHRDDLSRTDLRAYLLGLLNSTPMEWRFRLTSSNNNVNLYEVRALPLPSLNTGYPAERLEAYADSSLGQIRDSRISPLGLVRQITAGWGAPGRDDRAVARVIARLARWIESGMEPERRGWTEHVLDHLVNWHLGLDEPDLDRMLVDVPARAWKE
jgi:adenine-specific DNA-methyltransferase